MSNAHVKVSFGDATLDIEGTEEFVNAQVDKFVQSIRVRLAPNGHGAEPPPSGEPSKADDDIDLSGIFTVSDRGVLRIEHDIPGNTLRDGVFVPRD